MENSLSTRMLRRALEERDDLLHWRREDFQARRYHLLKHADAMIDRLSRLIDWLSDRDFDQRIGWKSSGR